MCDICGNVTCANWMHSPEVQERYSDVIAVFEAAREMRRMLREQIEAEEQIEELQQSERSLCMSLLKRSRSTGRGFFASVELTKKIGSPSRSGGIQILSEHDALTANRFCAECLREL
jgi:hypothetical protein